MHFGKELEEDLVPEWRAKYLNYKQGKKKIKAVQKALRNAHRTTPVPNHTPSDQSSPPSRSLPYTHYDFGRTQRKEASRDASPHARGETGFGAVNTQEARPRRQSVTMFSASPPVLMPGTQRTPEDSPETQPLPIPSGRADDYRRGGVRYGSIVGSPPSPKPLPELELPGPALNPNEARRHVLSPVSESADPGLAPLDGTAAESPSPSHEAQDEATRKQHSNPRRMFYPPSMFSKTRQNKQSVPRSKLRQMIASAGFESPGKDAVQHDAYRELDEKQADFFNFLDHELAKVENFYKMKEDEATERLEILRRQLHELRDRRMADIQEMRQVKEQRDGGMLEGLLPITPLPTAPFKDASVRNGQGFGHTIFKPVEKAVRRKSHIGKTSQAMEQLSSPTKPQPMRDDARQDYVRKSPTENESVPYRFAKRRLKLALQEFYRGLELLKSYALLNRTAFRKINKKYDKAVNARPTGRYMSEKVNNAHFVQSGVLDSHLVAVEDLYARYFERGNHKVAVGKLRTKLKPDDQSGPSFRNGLFVATGTVFGVFGIVNAAHHLNSPDRVIAVQSSYLLQLYAGYFLALLLFLMFVIDCMIWKSAKVNYIFVFEFDTRHVLDWRQLGELPCFFLFLNGLFLWLNFRGSGADGMFTFWPLVLIVITLIVMCLPFRVLYYNARKWWGFSNWRLLLAGLYPVEFRDFYLGDMYCSETYAMSQIELFFCLYVNDFDNPPQCNSNHSRLLGFFTTLPAVWRAFQCLRRFYDTRNWFPHIPNCAKYGCNILYYMSLSLYRIERNTPHRAIFIVFAALNGIYCSFWDVAYDFSLGNYYARYPFLRDRLAYRRPWVYYVAMIVDILLRQQWVFFAIFTNDLQHSALLSFFISLAEVFRRGLWSLFRVENEHCNNVSRYRASRDIPLPYKLPGMEDYERRSPEGVSQPSSGIIGPPSAEVSGADLERAPTQDTTGSLRQRRPPRTPQTPLTPGIRALQRVGSVIAAAHAQDYQHKKRLDITGQLDSPHAQPDPSREHEDSTDEEDEEGPDIGVDPTTAIDDDEREDEIEGDMLARRARGGMAG